MFSSGEVVDRCWASKTCPDRHGFDVQDGRHCLTSKPCPDGHVFNIWQVERCQALKPCPDRHFNIWCVGSGGECQALKMCPDRQGFNVQDSWQTPSIKTMLRCAQFRCSAYGRWWWYAEHWKRYYMTIVAMPAVHLWRLLIKVLVVFPSLSLPRVWQCLSWYPVPEGSPGSCIVFSE